MMVAPLDILNLLFSLFTQNLSSIALESATSNPLSTTFTRELTRLTKTDDLVI